MSFGKWQEIIEQAIPLGLESVHISGGEPVLYEYLFDLVSFCNGRNLEVNLNTNGYYLDAEYIQKLAKAGLNACTISIYSHNPFVHDRIKQVEGIHFKALKAISFLQSTPIRLYLQTVLISQTLHQFDKYLQWIGKFKPYTLFISYVEGGDSYFLPKEQDISQFVLQVIPRSELILKRVLGNDRMLLSEGSVKLKQLFQFQGVSYKDLSCGIYNRPNFKGCRVSHSLGLILANGDVHPCNAVEYYHSPVVGNLLKSSLEEIWNSEAWGKVRREGAGWCRYCPVNHHIKLRFRQTVAEYYQPRAG